MNRRYIIFFIVLLTLLPSFSSAGGGKMFYPKEVTAILDSAGANRTELEKVLSYYTSEDNSLKLKAAFFLISNMEGHSYMKYALKDTAGKEINFNPLDYPDYSTLESAFDTLKSRYGELDFKKKEEIFDRDTITADFLINQIDYAFRAWGEKPWAKNLSFENFREYVLPYRGSNEPLENWREMFWEKYKDIERKMVDPSNSVEAARLINDDIKSWFSFDPRYYYHPTDQGLSEMLKYKLGRCEDMTNLTIYAMRANGLAVTSDHTPAWADFGNNHAWNAIVTPDGRVIPFMGAEASPGEYRLAHKPAKVYRKMFGKQEENLVFQKRKQEKIPGWLAGKNYIDVTAEYEDVCEVTIPFKREIPDSVDVAYLCVFNDGEWKPIHWGWIKNGEAVFTDMGREIAYLPALYLNEKVVPFGTPFILQKDCTIRELEPESLKTISVKLLAATPPKQEISTGGIEKTYFTSGKKYELFYWKDEWQLLGSSIASEKPLVFEKLPAGSLYWLVPEGSDKEEERIFTIEDGKQVWW
ncbi:MAG: hypothetical protein MUO78_06965 [candidate division Zixibacteria bacterium]|nr:hypothetical protein [candidate division Zixibacteria bacterium]